MSKSNSTPQTAQQDLNEIARRVRDAIAAAKAAHVTALHSALDAGNALIEAQAQVPRGQWRRWLKDNCLLSERTALLYVQLAHHRQDIETEISRVPELSLRAARRLIAKPKPKSPKSSKASKPTAAAPPPALARKLTKAFKLSLSLAGSTNEDDRALALAGLVGIQSLLVGHGHDLHDLVIGVREKPARSSARRRAA
jgi:hypothetical protein